MVQGTGVSGKLMGTWRLTVASACVEATVFYHYAGSR